MGTKSQEDILKGYIWALGKMRPTLRMLFRAAIKSQKDLHGLQLRRQKKFNLLQVGEWAATLERAPEIYATAIFLVLVQWIRALHKRLGLNPTDTCFGETIRNVSLAELIRAAANNFRYHDDWDKPDKRGRLNINVLAEAGIFDVRDNIVAPQALMVLGVTTYKELEARVRAIGKDMLARAQRY